MQRCYQLACPGGMANFRRGACGSWGMRGRKGAAAPPATGGWRGNCRIKPLVTNLWQHSRHRPAESGHMNRFTSISNLLQLITGVMAAVLVFTFTVSAERAWERWNTSLEAHAVSDASRDLFLGMQSLRVERGTVNTALSSAEVASPDTLGDIVALRGKSDAALESAITKLGKLHLPDAVTRIGELRGARETVTRLRQDVDAAIRRAQAERSPTLSKSWISAVGAVVDTI